MWKCWTGNVLQPLSSLHAICTHLQCGYLLNLADAWQGKLDTKTHRQKFPWHPPPTGASNPVTKAAVGESVPSVHWLVFQFRFFFFMYDKATHCSIPLHKFTVKLCIYVNLEFSCCMIWVWEKLNTQTKNKNTELPASIFIVSILFHYVLLLAMLLCKNNVSILLEIILNVSVMHFLRVLWSKY